MVPTRPGIGWKKIFQLTFYKLIRTYKALLLQIMQNAKILLNLKTNLQGRYYCSHFKRRKKMELQWLTQDHTVRWEPQSWVSALNSLLSFHYTPPRFQTYFIHQFLNFICLDLSSLHPVLQRCKYTPKQSNFRAKLNSKN